MGVVPVLLRRRFTFCRDTAAPAHKGQELAIIDHNFRPMPLIPGTTEDVGVSAEGVNVDGLSLG